MAAEHVEIGVLVAPVLPPVLRDGGPYSLPVDFKEQNHDVLQADEVLLVLDDVHRLRRPGLIRDVAIGVARIE